MPVVSRLIAAFGAISLGLAAALAPASPAAAQGQFDRPKYASIVVDANSGEVLYALRADQKRFPASITKVMTLYLTFEALATGRLKLDDRVPFSAHASAQAPSKLGVAPGGDISVNEAIQAAAVMSANDVAVALAEKVGGSEARFAQLMTLRAQELGMAHSYFVNANGLPDTRQVTTARDIAVLSRAVMRDYPQYYSYFNQHSFTWRGRTVLNHNRLLLRMAGMDGLKTGYTNAAGFNLAASAVRDGRRLITVVLGGSSTAARDENVENLLQAGFDVMNRRAHGQTITLASALNEPDDSTNALMRPAMEMGSADQAGLKVVMGQPVPNPAATLRVARADAAAPRAVPAVIRAQVATECETVRVRVHHRHVMERRCHTVTPSTLADCRKRHGRHAHACKVEATQVARAAPVAVDCSRLHGRKAHACRSQAARVTATAPVQTAAADCKGLHGRKLRACRRTEAAPAAVALRTCKPGRRHHAAACAVEGSSSIARVGSRHHHTHVAKGERPASKAKAHKERLAEKSAKRHGRSARA